MQTGLEHAAAYKWKLKNHYQNRNGCIAYIETGRGLIRGRRQHCLHLGQAWISKRKLNRIPSGEHLHFRGRKSFISLFNDIFIPHTLTQPTCSHLMLDSILFPRSMIVSDVAVLQSVICRLLNCAPVGSIITFDSLLRQFVWQNFSLSLATFPSMFA